MSIQRRVALIQAFDDIRPSFLAALDQIVAEVRPAMQESPNFYPMSVLACAEAFSDPDMVKSQLAAIQPDLGRFVSDDEITDAHLATMSYLFSLALHELMRGKEQMPHND